jgi:acyl-coenzyme A synthetase/AMP-(fatty) acid ligase
LLNYAENLLSHYDSNKIAIYSHGEAFKQTKSITFGNLRKRVQLYQLKLKQFGIKSGDRVVGRIYFQLENYLLLLILYKRLHAKLY